MLLHFFPVQSGTNPGESLPKISFDRELSILAKISGLSLEIATERLAQPIFVHRIVRYFVKALDFVPLFVGTDGKRGKSEDYKEFRFGTPERHYILALLNSSLFYWFWRVHGDGFHCGYGDVYSMPYRACNDEHIASMLESAGAQLMKSLKVSSAEKAFQTRSGSIIYQEFYPKRSKIELDAIDAILAEHYGFTADELDFLINYDVKYRMGIDADSNVTEPES
jgi:hypothetical protein